MTISHLEHMHMPQKIWTYIAMLVDCSVRGGESERSRGEQQAAPEREAETARGRRGGTRKYSINVLV